MAIISIHQPADGLPEALGDVLLVIPRSMT
jgi:hypothetical protein